MLRFAVLLLCSVSLTFSGCDVSAVVNELSTTNPDQEAAELLAEKDSVAEAKAWLAGDPKQHVLWKGSRPEIIKLVDDLYAAGAKDVSAVDISKEASFELVAMFLVTLPADATARGKVFAAHNDFWKTCLVDADEDDLADFTATDKGQKYLLLNFDL